MPDATESGGSGAREGKDKEPEVERVVAERPDFGAISKRFASGGERKAEGQGEEPVDRFAAARDAFAKIEAGVRVKGEGVVSAVARGFEKGEMGGSKAKEEGKGKDGGESKPAGEGKVVAEKPESVGNIASRFEGVTVAARKEDKEEAQVGGFESAAKVFGTDAAEEQQEAGGGRVADAAKVFGGK